jgi:hypothetical protein
MAVCTLGACTVTASLCYYGMPLQRLATGTEPQSTTVGSMRSVGYSTARSTSISCPTLCFLMGAHGPRGLLRPTWTMLWRRMLTWHSLLCAHRTWLPLQACPSDSTLSRTALTKSGRLIWMWCAMSFRSTTTVAGRTWPDMLSTCFSYNMTLNASLQSSGVVLLVLLM